MDMNAFILSLGLVQVEHAIERSFPFRNSILSTSLPEYKKVSEIIIK